MGIDGDWERGRVWLKKLRTENRADTIYRRPHNTSTELVHTGEIVPGWNEDFTGLWKEATEEANLREWEKQAAARHVYLHLLSGNVAQIPAGPPLTRGGAVSQQAKEFAHFLHDLAKRLSLVDPVLARIHRVEWRCGH